MRTGPDWRSPITAAEFAELDYADFAQEFLRRNPQYCAEYHDLVRRIAVEDLHERAEMEVLARRWGLRFPLRPGPLCNASTRIMVTRAFSSDRRSRRRAR